MLPIDGSRLTLDQLVAVARHRVKVQLEPRARREMLRSYAWVQQAVEGTSPVYGVNTGYGSLARVRIPREKLNELSRNLVRSHAAGVGEPLPEDVARATVLLRANALAKGMSGCSPELVERLLDLLNAGVTPMLPSQGSCGSSGDLAPLSHLGLIIGHAPQDPDEETGEAWFEGERLSGREALRRAGLEPLVLGPKEGLALTNGAQVTTAITALALHDAAMLLDQAELAAAMSIEALRGVTRAFHPQVIGCRPYPGVVACAATLLRHLEGSELVDTVPGKVQDAYSLRCAPQILGAARDALGFVHQQVAVELNAVTDNPVIAVDAEGEDKAFSSGLFHGEPVGMAADFLKVAVAEVASLAERRIYRLTTGLLNNELPALLGDGVGLFALQTTAASLVSECKVLSYPASVDSIPTCEDQEDHVAMSTTAARRCAEVVANARRVVAIELLCAHRALRMHSARLGDSTGRAAEVLDAVKGLTPSEQAASAEALMDRLL